MINKQKITTKLLLIIMIVTFMGLFVSCENKFESQRNSDGTFSGTLVSTKINNTIKTVNINKGTGKEDDQHYFLETNKIEAYNLYKEDFSDQYNVYRIDFIYNDTIDDYIIKQITFDVTLTREISMYFILCDTFSEDNLVSLSSNFIPNEKQTITLDFEYDAALTPENKTKGLQLNFCSSPCLNNHSDILLPKVIGNFTFTYASKDD